MVKTSANRNQQQMAIFGPQQVAKLQLGLRDLLKQPSPGSGLGWQNTVLSTRHRFFFQKQLLNQQALVSSCLLTASFLSKCHRLVTPRLRISSALRFLDGLGYGINCRFINVFTFINVKAEKKKGLEKRPEGPFRNHAGVWKYL